LLTTLVFGPLTTMAVGCGSAHLDDDPASSSTGTTMGSGSESGEGSGGAGGSDGAGATDGSSGGTGGDAGAAGGGGMPVIDEGWVKWSNDGPDGWIVDILIAHGRVWALKNSACGVYHAPVPTGNERAVPVWEHTPLPPELGCGAHKLAATPTGIAFGIGLKVTHFTPQTSSWSPTLTIHPEPLGTWVFASAYEMVFDQGTKALIWVNRLGPTRSLPLDSLLAGSMDSVDHDPLPIPDFYGVAFAQDEAQGVIYALRQNSEVEGLPDLAHFSIGGGWVIKSGPPGIAWNSAFAASHGRLLIAGVEGTYARGQDGLWSDVGEYRQMPEVCAFGLDGQEFLLMGGASGVENPANPDPTLPTGLVLSFGGDESLSVERAPVFPLERAEFGLLSIGNTAVAVGGYPEGMDTEDFDVGGRQLVWVRP
jgi:hypothetical protein